jgi:SCY1-like protein 2
MFTIKSLSQKIESEQIRKLSELSTTTQGVQSAGDFLSFGGAPGLNAMNGRISPSLAGETDFERLVFGKKDTSPISASNGFDRPDASTAVARTSTPPMQSMRAKSPANITTVAPKFSWSTPSPTSSHAGQTGVSLNSVLTPSPALSAMPSQSSGMGVFTPLQPARGGVGFGSTTGMRPQPGSGSSGSGVNWAEAAKPVQSFSPPSQPMGQMMAGLNLGGAASSQTSGLNGLGSFGGMGATAPTGIKKGGGIQLTNFGGSMPAPTQQSFSGGLGGMSAMGGGGMNTNTSTMGRNMNAGLPGMGVEALKKEDKGLDKWESLL